MGDTLDVSVIKKLKVVELKATLSARGLSTKGKKDELVKRLVEAMETESNDDPKTEDTTQSEPEVAEEASEEASEEAVDTSQDESQSIDAEKSEEMSETVETAVAEPEKEVTNGKPF